MRVIGALVLHPTTHTMKLPRFTASTWLPTLLASLARRRPAATGDGNSIDRRTALYNRGGLLAHGKELLADCRATGRELTLAVFECSDLVEARTLYGDRTSRKLIDGIVAKLALLAGADGLAARTGPTQFAVALPMSRERAVQAIERVLGNPTRFELEGCRSEIVLVPHLMVEAVPAAGTVERMYSALCRGLARVQEEERMRNEYLQRQRERHSRPASIRSDDRVAEARPARAPVREPVPVMVPQVQKTIPMPLPMR
jgi:GGDEF domain-containing protein